MRPARSIRDLLTVSHELGHALAYAGTQARGLAAIPTDTQDEVVGMVLERIALELVVPAPDRQRLASIAAAETARTATSALFEIAVEAEREAPKVSFSQTQTPPR